MWNPKQTMTFSYEIHNKHWLLVMKSTTHITFSYEIPTNIDFSLEPNSVMAGESPENTCCPQLPSALSGLCLHFSPVISLNWLLTVACCLELVKMFLLFSIKMINNSFGHGCIFSKNCSGRKKRGNLFTILAEDNVFSWTKPISQKNIQPCLVDGENST